MNRYQNNNQYNELDIIARKGAEAEQNNISDEQDSLMQVRESKVVSGLQSKYGFTESGAKATMAIIKKLPNRMGQHPIDNAKFANEEMKSAAVRAYEYYWSNFSKGI